MALTRQKKVSVIDEVSSLLDTSKMTVVATYKGTSVKAMQTLRRQAKTNATTVKVIKNRLVIQAIKRQQNLDKLDISHLEGMLAYAFNPEDEIAAAQTLADFAKTNPSIEFVGAITPEGEWLGAEKVKQLSALPTKPVMIATVISLLNGPITTVSGTLNSLLPNIVSALNKAAQTN